MSQTETHFGKLIQDDASAYYKEQGDTEKWFEEYCTQSGIEKMESYHSSWQKCFIDNFGDEFVVVADIVYRIINDKECCGEDIFEAHKNELGQIEYCVSCYNGGCGYSEAIEEAIKRMNKV